MEEVKAVFWTTGAQDNDPVLYAAAEGLQRAGVASEMRALAAYDPAVPGIFYGLLGLGAHTPVGEWWVIDRGFFGAQRTGVGGYYRLARGGLQPQFRAGLAEAPGRLQRMGLKVPRWQYKADGIVLVCPPPQRTARFYSTDPVTWLAETLAALPPALGAKVVVRHKGDPIPLADHIAAARCVIVYNSNVAIDALMAGVPAFATAGIVRSWNGLGFEAADTPPKDFPHTRDDLFLFAAANQGPLADYKNGKVWRRAFRLQGHGFPSRAPA